MSSRGIGTPCGQSSATGLRDEPTDRKGNDMTEITDAAVGRRSKGGPVPLLALVLGVAVPLWLVQRSRGTGPVELGSYPSVASEADGGGV